MKLSSKNKQLLSLLVKILIVVVAFYFIYEQLSKSASLNWSQLHTIVTQKTSVWFLVFIIFLSVQNRFLEILKWQNLVGSFKMISIGAATKQVLASLTVGMVTPNGIGEYAGKAFFYEKIHTKNILFLNVICNGIQLLLSVFFGILGLLFLGYYQWVMIILGIAIVVFIVAIALKKTTIKGYSISVFTSKITEIPIAIHQKNFFLGLLRYLTFSHQYYFLFILFDVQLPYLPLMSAIAAMYFVSSSLPAFQFLDFAVKGSVAVFFMGKLGINEWIVVLIAAVMWFLNVVLPVCIGVFYVLKFKISEKL